MERCPRRESNPQSPGFKPGRSAGWRTRAFRARAGAVGLEPTSGPSPPPRFQDEALIRPVGSLKLAIPAFRGLESNQRPPRSERGVTTNRNCPGSFLLVSSRRTLFTPFEFGGQGSNLRTPGSKPGVSTIRNYPRVSQSVPRDSNPRVRLGKPVPCHSARDAFTSQQQSGGRGSRTLKAHRSAAFETATVASRLAPPWSRGFRERSAPGEGFEPPRISAPD